MPLKSKLTLVLTSMPHVRMHTDSPSWPLAVCDGSTLAESDVIEAEHRRETFSETSLYCLPRKSHRWYFQSRHRPDEALLVKIYDSNTEVKARCKMIARQDFAKWQLLILFRLSTYFFQASKRTSRCSITKEHRSEGIGFVISEGAIKHESQTGARMFDFISCFTGSKSG